MRKLDFISAAPNLSIFKSGANKTNLGGVLFFIYIIILILLAVIYCYHYINQESYSFEYTLVKNLTNKIENEQAESIANTEVDFLFSLKKDFADKEEDLNANNNFLIIDLEKLEEKLYFKGEDYDPTDNYTFINTDDNSKDECIIRKDVNYKKKLKDF